MTGSNKNFENRVRRLEVIAISAKVVNVALQAPLVLKKKVNGSELSLTREMLGNYKCDYRLEGNLPGDRQRSVRKKDRSKQTKPVNKETTVNLRRRCAIAARRQK